MRAHSRHSGTKAVFRPEIVESGLSGWPPSTREADVSYWYKVRAPLTPGGYTGLSMADVEKMHIANTLKLTSGNREKAAKMLGIGARTLYRKLKVSFSVLAMCIFSTRSATCR